MPVPETEEIAQMIALHIDAILAKFKSGQLTAKQALTKIEESLKSY